MYTCTMLSVSLVSRSKEREHLVFTVHMCVFNHVVAGKVCTRQCHYIEKMCTITCTLLSVIYVTPYAKRDLSVQVMNYELLISTDSVWLAL